MLMNYIYFLVFSVSVSAAASPMATGPNRIIKTGHNVKTDCKEKME